MGGYYPIERKLYLQERLEGKKRLLALVRDFIHKSGSLFTMILRDAFWAVASTSIAINTNKAIVVPQIKAGSIKEKKNLLPICTPVSILLNPFAAVGINYLESEGSCIHEF